jgi:hypothetical protein
MVIDIDLAVKQRSIRGRPLIAADGSNYPAGYVVDYFCLVCGRVFAAHGDDSDCGRVVDAAALMDVRKTK